MVMSRRNSETPRQPGPCLQCREKLPLHSGCGLAVERGLIRDVNDPVGRYIHDGGYDSAHNAQITWKEHLQQTSEWEGTLWGKNSDFVGAQEFGTSQQPPHAIHPPGSVLGI